MSKYVLVGVLIIGVAVVSYIGCDGAKARIGVAQDQAIKKIDDLLGPLNVQQKKVELAYEELKTATSGMREKRIEAEVRLKAYTAKKSEMDDKKGKLVSNLTKLRGFLADAESTGSIERNGKTISADELQALADNAIKEMKMVKDQIAKNDVISTAWAKNLDLLKKNETTSTAQLKKLENQLDQIRSKKSALDAMKEAATIAGPGASISDKFKELTESVDELLISIDTEFNVEEAKLDERMAEMTEDVTLNIEDILDDKTDVSGTLSDIDKLLNEEGGK